MKRKYFVWGDLVTTHHDTKEMPPMFFIWYKYYPHVNHLIMEATAVIYCQEKEAQYISCDNQEEALTQWE